MKRFTQVRSASAEINAVMIEFTRKYLCLLINHLIEAGKIVGKHVNLIAFQVRDILKAKLDCDERTFIRIINNVNDLKLDRQFEKTFELVRCINKMD